jgi:hypothetical protein
MQPSSSACAPIAVMGERLPLLDGSLTWLTCHGGLVQERCTPPTCWPQC